MLIAAQRLNLNVSHVNGLNSIGKPIVEDSSEADCYAHIAVLALE